MRAVLRGRNLCRSVLARAFVTEMAPIFAFKRHSQKNSPRIFGYHRRATMRSVTSTHQIHDFAHKEGKTHCILSWFILTDQPVKSAREHVFLALSTIGALGRVYVANEGINAQILLKPSTALWRKWDKLRKRDEKLHILLPDLDAMQEKSESGVWLTEEEYELRPPFRKLDVRTRSLVLANNDSECGDLDIHDYGTPLEPEQWAERLSQETPPTCIDIRNHYESDLGHFRGAIKPQTMTNREMNGLGFRCWRC